MKKLALIMLAVVSMALVSCGGGSTGVMTPQTTKISGDLGNEFEVVDKPAKLSKTGIFNVWTIELKSLTDDHSGDYFVERVPVGTITADGYTHEHVGFGLETYDKDGNLVAKRSAAEGGMGGVYSSEDIMDLMRLKEGETGFIRWSSKDDEETLKGLTFKISSIVTTDNR